MRESKKKVNLQLKRRGELEALGKSSFGRRFHWTGRFAKNGGPALSGLFRDFRVKTSMGLGAGEGLEHLSFAKARYI